MFLGSQFCIWSTEGSTFWFVYL